MASVFVDRWSPRSFTSDPVTDDELAALFEAARWAPSWMNNQPWLFVYETDGDNRGAILESFMDFNRGWAEAAPVVGLILARTELEGFMARTRDFDVGAATMALTLQATMLGLSVHLLGGIDLDAAYAATGADAGVDRDSCRVRYRSTRPEGSVTREASRAGSAERPQAGGRVRRQRTFGLSNATCVGGPPTRGATRSRADERGRTAGRRRRVRLRVRPAQPVNRTRRRAHRG